MRAASTRCPRPPRSRPASTASSSPPGSGRARARSTTSEGTNTETHHAAGQLERARVLAPLLEDLSKRTEEDRGLPEPVLRALHDASLFRLLLPAFLDGGEIEPVTFVLV